MATVTSVEVKTTSTGKPFKGCALGDGRKINVFSDHPLYPEIEQGFDIPDTLIYQKGQYWNLSDPSRRAQKGASTRANNARSADIKEAQDRKETSIAFFNATNGAVELIARMGGDTNWDSTDEIQKKIRFWRDWFLAEHDKYKGHKEIYPEADPLANVKLDPTEEGQGPIDW